MPGHLKGWMEDATEAWKYEAEPIEHMDESVQSDIQAWKELEALEMAAREAMELIGDLPYARRNLEVYDKLRAALRAI